MIKYEGWVGFHRYLPNVMLDADLQAKVVEHALADVPEEFNRALQAQWVLCQNLQILVALAVQKEIVSREALLENAVKHLGTDASAKLNRLLTEYETLIAGWDKQVEKFTYTPPKG